ncbi:hypothetical protein ACF1GW_38655 [Streptomyces achromogenes]|uniref:hypothetical protein n=1 Tax=Streptomyces achromogenes TaxID=67255 RepID=UPI0036F84553
MSDWMIMGRVRVIADIEVTNIDPGRPRTYKAGEELNMILKGREGQPLSEARWWSSMDIDAAHILDANDVEVLEMTGPYWVKCGGCGAGGQIEVGNDGLPYLDAGERIAQA